MNPVTERTAESALPLERDGTTAIATVSPCRSCRPCTRPWSRGATQSCGFRSIMASFGWQKLFDDKMSEDIAIFHQLGLEPAIAPAYSTSGSEFFGGLAVAAGSRRGRSRRYYRRAPGDPGHP